MEPRAVREKLGLNQQQFWSRIGLTQSAGSRYENGRRLPKPVRLLLDIAYCDDRGMKKTLRQLRGHA